MPAHFVRHIPVFRRLELVVAAIEASEVKHSYTFQRRATNVRSLSPQRVRRSAQQLQVAVTTLLCDRVEKVRSTLLMELLDCSPYVTLHTTPKELEQRQIREDDRSMPSGTVPSTAAAATTPSPALWLRSMNEGGGGVGGLRADEDPAEAGAHSACRGSSRCTASSPP